MQTRGVIGQTIVRVTQERVYDSEYGWQVEVHSFILDNGKRVVFQACPTVDCPIVTATTCKKGE